MIKAFVKKPVKVQAVQWTGDNYEEIADFIGGVRYIYHLNDEYIISYQKRDHCLRNGDWIIREVNGDIHRCDPDIFEKTYEEVRFVHKKRIRARTIVQAIQKFAGMYPNYDIIGRR